MPRFGQASVRWNELGPNGLKYLRIIARHRMNRRGPARAAIPIDNGVDSRAKDSNGKTALDIALASRNKKIVDVLVETRNRKSCKTRVIIQILKRLLVGARRKIPVILMF